MTYEKFTLKRKSYKSDDLIEDIKDDMLERGENIINNLIEKEVHNLFGENVKLKKDKKLSKHHYDQTTHYPDLVYFDYKDYNIRFGLNSTRAKITLSIYDNILEDFIESFGPKLKKLSDSTNVENAIKKLKLAFDYLLKEEYMNLRRSKTGMKKYNI